MLPTQRLSPTVSIVIPVFNKVAFTRQCLDRIKRHASDQVHHQVIVVDNGSSDGTQDFLTEASQHDPHVVYLRHEENLGFSRGNNIGVGVATGRYVLFLNNDTIVQPGWLQAMVRVAESNERVGIVGIKQLFPYSNKIHHTGIIFTADRRPQHIYPHADGSLPYVNKQREYQAVTGSCLLMPRKLFVECGMFDEGYVNGYEDIDLCFTVRARNRTVVCCTTSFIYHYGQITETRTADDDKNLARFLSRWGDKVQPDELAYFREDQAEIEAARGRPEVVAPRAVEADRIYFADDLSAGSALTWVTGELVLAMDDLRLPVTLKQCRLSASLEAGKRRRLEKLMLPAQPFGGVQIRWSHYWPQHLNLELAGATNLELFVINYVFDRPNTQPWDYWLQVLAQNRHLKLPLSTFSRQALLQTGVNATDCHILRPGYSPEILEVAAPARRSDAFRFLTVTNSHDLERYGTKILLDAYWKAFHDHDDVVLVVKDYGASSGDATLKKLLRPSAGRARVEYRSDFTSKEALIELYKSCDAFVSAHRGEGYGMKILDAMACGLPVITPLFGGPTDFCTEENSFAVDFSLVPVGDCYDTRAISILNGPVWAQPDPQSLADQLRRVAGDTAAARRKAEIARADVVERFTWQQAAQEFGGYLAAVVPARQPPRRAPMRQAAPTERSPYWMGLRITVIIPTYNRKEMLLKCLRALDRQTILPQEFEVVVVDDGSSDGTGEMLATEQFRFGLKYHRQENKGPGTARNEGLRLAEGELILYIGDDIIATERLLEEHLMAHATRVDPGASVLGHIDWPPEMTPSMVMNFVCGESTLQFAYAVIPKLDKLDYRFFYTSNVSIRRDFLAAAAADHVAFDPDFRFAAFEDSELAYRLEKRGLDLRYHAAALAYHEHRMDVQSFANREYRAGQMAVVFYRKHPQMDDLLQVRWIGDWTDAVETLAAKAEIDRSIGALDRDTDALLRSLAQTLEGLIEFQSKASSPAAVPKFTPETLKRSLDSVVGLIFEVERTRGKVQEWYKDVKNPATVEAAKRLIGCMRKLEFFANRPAEIKRLQETISWLDTSELGSLRNRIAELEGQLRMPGAGSRLRRIDRTAWRVARKVDLIIQQQLGRRGWLGHYQSFRHRLIRLMPPSRQAPH